MRLGAKRELSPIVQSPVVSTRLSPVSTTRTTGTTSPDQSSSSTSGQPFVPLRLPDIQDSTEGVAEEPGGQVSEPSSKQAAALPSRPRGADGKETVPTSKSSTPNQAERKRQTPTEHKTFRFERRASRYRPEARARKPSLTSTKIPKKRHKRSVSFADDHGSPIAEILIVPEAKRKPRCVLM